MPDLTPQALLTLTAGLAAEPPPEPGPHPPRLMSIWEITTWVLPMAPEHLRRTLAANPALPQGSAGEGTTRWFTLPEVASLRAHFAARARSNRYGPARPVPNPEGAPDTPGTTPATRTANPAVKRAPLITLTGPGGQMGRTTALVHLATAACLSGYRVLVIDGDPAGTLAQTLHAQGPAPTADILTLLARSAALHLRALNQQRLDRGEAPTPMDAAQSASLTRTAADLIRPTAWPGLDLIAATPGLMQADMGLTSWRLTQRSWQPWQALAEALTSDALRAGYDLILCDTPRGLGPLALSLLTSADILLAPLPLRPTGLADLGRGLTSLATTAQTLQDERQITARALGQTAAAFGWQRLAVLPTRAAAEAARHLASAAALGDALLPCALPELPAVPFYDLDYRQLGRLPYAPLRDACDAAWAGVAALLKS